MNKLPTLLVKVPAQIESTDHFVTQRDAISLLYKAGASNFKWHHSAGSDQFFCGNFSDKQLIWLGLFGVEIIQNLTEVRYKSVKDKIKQALSTLSFDKDELDDVDIKSVWCHSLEEHFGVE